MKKIITFLICFLCFVCNVNAYTKSVVDITNMDIYQIQEAIDNGYLTYENLTKMYLERIEVYDKKFNSIITINSNAIEEAKQKDIEYKANGRNSVLFGIPIVVKDNIDVKGMPTTAGSKTLLDNYPKEDSEIIKNIKEKGAIILAKTNMSEFAFEASSSISSFGTVKNAYNTEYTSYGSSGGTAVAVSLQFAPLGIGTDTNASLRVPASANNVIGFRPSLGLLSNKGILLYDMTRDTSGAITKTVQENAILLEAMSGNKQNYLSNIKELNLNNIKIGVLTQFINNDSSGIYGTRKTYTQIIQLMDETIQKLKDNGAEVVYLDDFYNNTYKNVDSDTLGGWTMCYSYNNYIKNTNSKINTFSKLVSASGHITNLWSYLPDCLRDISRVNDYESIKKDYNNYVKKVYVDNNLDVLIYPTTKNKLLKIDEDISSFESPSYSIAPVLGYPALSIGIGSIDNLYYGMDVVALKNNENTLYDFAYLYEKISKTYKLSSLAKPLYEIPDNAIKLKELYEKNINRKIVIDFNFDTYKQYRKIEKEVEQFLFNYNDYDNEVEKSKELYELYNNITLELNRTSKESYIILSIVIIALIITIPIIIKRKKKS